MPLFNNVPPFLSPVTSNGHRQIFLPPTSVASNNLTGRDLNKNQFTEFTLHASHKHLNRHDINYTTEH